MRQPRKPIGDFTALTSRMPILNWSRDYNRKAFTNDIIAGVIVTIMLIPQSLAYALLAGLPPEAGIYASIVPVFLYAVFGTSRFLAVGPVAIVSLMTATAIAQVAEQGTAGYAVAALSLAFLSGVILLLLGLLRLGFLANFLSHAVIAGFITASALLIATSQLKHLFGVHAGGHTLPEMLNSIVSRLGEINVATLIIGLGALLTLLWIRTKLKPLAIKCGVPKSVATFLTRVGPVLVLATSTLLAWTLDLPALGVSVVGDVPSRLPPFTLPDFSVDLLRQLAMPAILISVIGFVESMSVAETLAAKRGQRVDSNQELIGLGAANIGAAFTGGYPVTGGLARSIVNFDAGAETLAAGAFAAVGLAIAAVALTPLVYFLPQATLAAMIIVAVLSLVDLSILRRTWRYSRTDFAAVCATILLTLGFGVEIGVASGVALSILLHLFKTSRPHVAEVGLVPKTNHFRNVNRHKVITDPRLLTLRVDESLYFVNARFLEELIQERVGNGGELRNIVLMCSAVNEIDFSALECLEAINTRLKELGIGLHLSEVKGPVMDKLDKSHFLTELNGQVFLSQFDAWVTLSESLERDEPFNANPPTVTVSETTGRDPDNSLAKAQEAFQNKRD